MPASRSEPFGPNTKQVQAFLLRLATMLPGEVGILADHWRPTGEFLSAGAAAWKAARKAKIYAGVQNSYDLVFATVPRLHPEWQRALNTAGNAALAVALGSRLDAKSRDILMAGWLAAVPDWGESAKPAATGSVDNPAVEPGAGHSSAVPAPKVAGPAR